MNGPQQNQRPLHDGPCELTERERFAAQYCQAYPRLKFLALVITGDRDHAEDIVQEAAIIAFEKSDSFQAGSNFVAWLSEIVRRCALNFRRKSRHRRTFAADPQILSQMTAQSSATTEPWPIAISTGEILDDQASFNDEVLHALQELGEDARCCLLLRTVQKLRYTEIAELMQIPEGTVMSHVHRSKTALRQKLSGTSGPNDKSLHH